MARISRHQRIALCLSILLGFVFCAFHQNWNALSMSMDLDSQIVADIKSKTAFMLSKNLSPQTVACIESMKLVNISGEMYDLIAQKILKNEKASISKSPEFPVDADDVPKPSLSAFERMFKGVLAIPDALHYVTSCDVILGHQWKTYMYDLGPEFNTDALKALGKDRKRSNSSCLIQLCPGFQHQHPHDYSAEAVILIKLLRSLSFVDDIKQADLVLVPALPVIRTLLRCRNHGACENAWFGKLKTRLNHLEDPDAPPHLFLGSQDKSQNHAFIRQQKFVVNLGPDNTGLVVPPLNLDPFVQPENYVNVPFARRDVFLLYAAGRRPWRTEISKWVQKFADESSKTSTNKKVIHNPSGTSVKPSREMGARALFTVCPSGDLPYQKRFFDALLYGSIPVVIYQTHETYGKYHWFNDAWQPQVRGDPFYSVLNSYPEIGIPIEDFIVEIPVAVLKSGSMLKFLEDLPEELVQKKFELIQKHRNKFIFSFAGDVPDAFSVLLRNIERIVKNDKARIHKSPQH